MSNQTKGRERVFVRKKAHEIHDTFASPAPKRDVDEEEENNLDELYKLDKTSQNATPKSSSRGILSSLKKKIGRKKRTIENQSSAPPVSNSQQLTPPVSNRQQLIDNYNNPAGTNNDLVEDGQMEGLKILIGDLCYGNGQNAIVDLPGGPGAALTLKGFKWDLTADVNQFLKMLQGGDYDLAWIISFQQAVPLPNEFAKIVRQFHMNGNGLFIFSDDDPHKDSASNAVLKDLFDSDFFLTGNKPAGKHLNPHVDGTLPSTFKREHPIMDGIVNLYEGITICHPSKEHPEVEILATSSDNHPCVLYFDHRTRGRVIIDTGFTKLHNCSGYWESAGTGRYVRNASCWLTGAKFLDILELFWNRLKDKLAGSIYSDILVHCLH
jgi:hypothetical protein